MIFSLKGLCLKIENEFLWESFGDNYEEDMLPIPLKYLKNLSGWPVQTLHSSYQSMCAVISFRSGLICFASYLSSGGGGGMMVYDNDVLVNQRLVNHLSVKLRKIALENLLPIASRNLPLSAVVNPPMSWGKIRQRPACLYISAMSYTRINQHPLHFLLLFPIECFKSNNVTVQFDIFPSDRKIINIIII